MEALLFSLLPLIIIFVIASIGRVNNELHDRKYKLKEERLARQKEEKKKWEIYNKNLERKLKSKQELNRRLSISMTQLNLEDKLVKSIIKFISRDVVLKHDYDFESADLLTVRDKIAFFERCLRSCHIKAEERLNSRNQDIIREEKKRDLQQSFKSKTIHEEKALQGEDILDKQKPERFSTCKFCNGEGCLKCDFRGYND
tara:strand:+ start:1387 stop:1986 length:600 start_codon:yes stop_codon:yes gene_type:complete